MLGFFQSKNVPAMSFSFEDAFKKVAIKPEKENPELKTQS